MFLLVVKIVTVSFHFHLVKTIFGFGGIGSCFSAALLNGSTLIALFCLPSMLTSGHVLRAKLFDIVIGHLTLAERLFTKARNVGFLLLNVVTKIVRRI